MYFQVSSEDKLPKMVCITCIKRLEGIHRFAMMACRTQEMLKLKLYGVFDNADSTQDIDIAEIRDIQNSGKKIEEKSLLHSILTKVIYLYEHNIHINMITNLTKKRIINKIFYLSIFFVTLKTYKLNIIYIFFQ